MPHGIPFDALPLATQVEAPVAQDVLPVLHKLPPGTHATFAVHDTQLPFEQTRLLPHGAPLPSAVPVSVHVGVPPAHESDPV
jgi:hypothetical protein